MERILFFIVTLLIISFSQAQTDEFKSKRMTIDSCTETIGIATFNNLSALWDYETNDIIGKLDSSFYQYYPNRKCLIEIRHDDSLFFYDMRYDQPKFLFATKDKLRVDVINDSLIGFWGKSFYLGGHHHDLPNGVPVQGEFGVELLGNTVIIIDYKFREGQNQEPIKGDDGNYIFHTDSISGESYYLYKNGKAGYSQGGVRDRLTKGWIIEPCANWIVKGHSTFVLQKTQFFERETYRPNHYYYSIYDHQGLVIVDSLSETQLLGNPEYLKMMVPFYQSDSVYSKEPYRTFLLPGRLYFKYKGKTGYFHLTSNYVEQKPVDFMSNSFGNVLTIINEDSILFKLYYRANELLFNLKAGDSYAFYPVGESDSNRDHGNFRIKRNGTDSVYIFHYEPYSNSTRLVTKVGYDSSYLKTLLEEPFGNDCFRLNTLWGYVIEIYDEGLINVTNNMAEFFEEPAKRNYSGLFDLKKHKWIIENKYHSIIRTDVCYIAYLVDPKKDDTLFDKYSFDGVLQSN